MNSGTCSCPQQNSLTSTCTQPIRGHVVLYKLVFMFLLFVVLSFLLHHWSQCFAHCSVFSSQHHGPLSSFCSVDAVTLMFLIKSGSLFLFESSKYLLFSFVKAKITKTSCRTSESFDSFSSLSFYYELQCAT